MNSKETPVKNFTAATASDDRHADTENPLNLRPGLNEPVFQEPWEAEVFAMTLLLHERGLFSWQQWADQLSTSIKQAQQAGDPDDGSTYYLHWLTALEDLLVEQNIADRPRLNSLFQAWDSAAKSTPHGQAIELKT